VLGIIGTHLTVRFYSVTVVKKKCTIMGPFQLLTLTDNSNVATVWFVYRHLHSLKIHWRYFKYCKIM